MKRWILNMNRSALTSVASAAPCLVLLCFSSSAWATVKVVTPQQYGGSPGNADNQVPITKAIAAAGQGGIVQFSMGYWKHSGIITVSSGVTLQGVNAGAVLLATASATSPVNGPASGGAIELASGSVIEDITVQYASAKLSPLSHAANPSWASVSAVKSDNFVISNVAFYQSEGDAINVSGGTGGTISKCFIIIDAPILGSGILTHKTTNLTFVGCNIQGGSLAMVQDIESSNLMFTKNLLGPGESSSAYLIGSIAPQFLKNPIHGCHVYLKSVLAPVVSGNNFYGGAFLTVTNTVGAKISTNVFMNALVILSSQAVTVDSNTFEGVQAIAAIPQDACDINLF
jgi:hypothetical protein